MAGGGADHVRLESHHVLLHDVAGMEPPADGEGLGSG